MLILSCLTAYVRIIYSMFYLDTQYDVIKEAAEDLGWRLTEYDNEEFDVFWSDLP